MVDLNDILKTIKDSYSKVRNVDFDKSGLHFELEPLTTLEEVKILEASKDIDGAQYIESLKRHTLAFGIKQMNEMDLRKDIIEYEEDGESVSKSKYLFMVDYLSKFPSSLVDTLFDAFTNMQTELESRIKEDAKFEKFILSEEVPEERPEEFSKQLDSDTIPESEMTETEKLNKRVEEEVNQQGVKISEAGIGVSDVDSPPEVVSGSR